MYPRYASLRPAHCRQNIPIETREKFGDKVPLGNGNKTSTCVEALSEYFLL